MQLVRAVDETFCILVLGDFLGAASGFPDSPEVQWLLRRATPDTVMELTGHRPRIRVSGQVLNEAKGQDGEGGPVEELELTTLQDFDPAALYRRLNLLHPFREARDVARKGGFESGQPAAEPAAEKSMPPLPSADEDNQGQGGLLDAVLDATEPAAWPPGRVPGTKDDLEAFVRDAVRPHLVPDDSDEKARVAAVDEAAGRWLSNLLHMPGFQNLESLWRSVVFLLSRADTTGKVRVYLAHVPKSVLEADLESSENLAGSRLYELLSSPRLGSPGRRWAAVVGAYGFGPGNRDMDLLTDIARVTRAAEVPWFSEARFPGALSPEPAGDDPDLSAGFPESLPEGWRRFRNAPEAAWIGLTFPRFLVREPHQGSSKGGREPEFGEIVSSWRDLLWGQGSFLVASILARGYAREGWGFVPEHDLELGGMAMAAPAGESGSNTRSVEFPLSSPSARNLIQMGVMPVLGIPHRAGVRVGGIHPVASSRTSLHGWWTP